MNKTWMAGQIIDNYDLKVIRQGQEAEVQFVKIPHQLKSALTIEAVMKSIDSINEPVEIISELKKNKLQS